MPLYDYICQDCQKKFEVKATVAEYESGLNVRCPACASERVKRTLSVLSFSMGNGASSASESGHHHHTHSCGCGGHCSH